MKLSTVENGKRRALMCNVWWDREGNGIMMSIIKKELHMRSIIETSSNSNIILWCNSCCTVLVPNKPNKVHRHTFVMLKWERGLKNLVTELNVCMIYAACHSFVIAPVVLYMQPWNGHILTTIVMSQSNRMWIKLSIFAFFDFCHWNDLTEKKIETKKILSKCASIKRHLKNFLELLNLSLIKLIPIQIALCIVWENQINS
jgi:hypothetical protein